MMREGVDSEAGEGCKDGPMAPCAPPVPDSLMDKIHNVGDSLIYDSLKMEKDKALRRTFRITLADYQYMYNAQNGKCAICGKRSLKKALAVDHNHKTGAIRGLLCHKCNLALGIYEKMDIEKFDKYLSQYPYRREVVKP